MKPLEQKISEAVRAIKFAYHGAVLRSQAISSDINLRISGSRHLRSISHSEADRSSDEYLFVRKGSEANEANVELDDMWLCNRFYRQAVVELSHHLQSYRLQCQRLTEEKNSLGNKIKLLFVATMQLYCHERSRIFLESVDYLKKVRGNMMTWNTETDMSLSQTQSRMRPPASSVAGSGVDRVASTSIETIDAINTTLDVLEQTSNAVDILASLKLETPLASLPNCSEQILLQSIMQFTTLETANKILSSMKDDQKKGTGRRPSLLDDPSQTLSSSADQQQHVPSFADFISVKVIATADGLLHLFPLEEKKSTSRSGDFSKPFRSLKIEVSLADI
jgi:hypothetical protein